MLQRGQRIGMIKLGSTTELYIPKENVEQVTVQEGQSVKGAVTVLAQILSRDTVTDATHDAKEATEENLAADEEVVLKPKEAVPGGQDSTSPRDGANEVDENAAADASMKKTEDGENSKPASANKPEEEKQPADQAGKENVPAAQADDTSASKSEDDVQPSLFPDAAEDK